MAEYVFIDNLVTGSPLEVELPSEYEYLFTTDAADAVLLEAF